MGFRFVPKMVTLNDLERRNGHTVCVISQNSAAFCTYYVKAVEDRPIHAASEMQPEECSFQQYITFRHIRRVSLPARALKCSTLLSLAKI